MRQGILALVTALSVPAQFFSFAVTDSGTLYFNTSLITGDQDSRSKIYRIAGGPPELFATGGTGTPFAGPVAVLPVTSGDGSFTAYALNYPCISGSCGLAGGPRTIFQLPGSKYTFVNNLQVSRNGRFLLGPAFNLRTSVVELPGENAIQFPENFSAAGPQAITNAGTALVRGIPPQLYLIPLGNPPQPVPGTPAMGLASISPDGSRIVYERNTATAYELVLTDPQGANHRVLASLPLNLTLARMLGLFRYEASFANDGALLYLLPGEAILLPPGGESRRLYTGQNVQKAILSGDGQSAWLLTYSGQLLRIQTASAAAAEVIPETPSVTPGSLLAYPGSVIRMSGTGVSERTEVWLNGAVLPVSEVTKDGGAVQVPWDLANDAGGRAQPMVIRGPGNPFFQRVDFYRLDRPTITFERDFYSPAPRLQAAHQDFRGKITPEDPAVPGETIHVFARDMGPVSQPVRSGEKSPIAPVARVTTPMACYLIASGTNRAQGIVVPFAGLAAGSIGIYQIDVTIPAEWNEPKTALKCNFDSFENRFLGDSEPLDVQAGPLPSTSVRN